MRGYYRLLKFNRFIKNHHIKFAGIAILHILKRRHLYLNIDPVLNCNLRCRMCHFSDPNYKPGKEKLTLSDIDRIAEVSFGRAIKLQVGCAAEPTTYADFLYIIEKGKEYKIPNIALTTNANLLNEKIIAQIVDLGLDEIIISMHGVRKETYESLMKFASHEKFYSNLRFLNDYKKQKNTEKPDIRINYTFNGENFGDLNEFFDFWGDIQIKSLQIRPIRNLGNTDFNNFDIEACLPELIPILDKIEKEAKSKNITFLRPDLQNLKSETSDNYTEIIRSVIYKYISPFVFSDPDFDWRNETYDMFCRRTKRTKYLLKLAFTRKKYLTSTTDSLNYDIL
jgi:molybdenum cofactor biosynthesis enzyme MoaA